MVIPFDRQNDDVPFNMAQLFNQRVDRMLEQKTEAKICCDLHAWANLLEDIYTNISFKLTPAEKGAITAQIDKVWNYLNSPLPQNPRLRYDVQNLISKRSYQYLRELDLNIMGLIDKYKMIFPRTQTRWGTNKVKEQYKLDQK